LKTDVLQLMRGTDGDIPFVMATERLPGYERLVGRWSEAQHRAALADNRHAYFIARLESEQIGFAIVRDWGSPEHVACIKRIAVASPGQGHGRALLAALVERIFRGTDAHRIWLGVFPDNARARRATKPSASRPKASPAAVHSSAACTAMNWSWRCCGRNGAADRSMSRT
jgi:RimJ/RimL family protein N-acetyltransferase